MEPHPMKWKKQFAKEVFCLQVTQTVTFSLSCAGLKIQPLDYWKLNRGTKKRSKTEKKKQNRPFCSVLFSFDRRSQKNVKTYRPEELNILVLYVFTFLGKRLSKENKTKQKSVLIFHLYAHFSFLRTICTTFYMKLLMKTIFQPTDQMSHRDTRASPGDRTPQTFNSHECSIVLCQ